MSAQVRTSGRRLLISGLTLTAAALALAAVGSVYVTAVAAVVGSTAGGVGLLALCAS